MRCSYLRGLKVWRHRLSWWEESVQGGQWRFTRRLGATCRYEKRVSSVGSMESTLLQDGDGVRMRLEPEKADERQRHAAAVPTCPAIAQIDISSS